MFDEIGDWSEVKLEIIKKYSKKYVEILSKQKMLSFYYIDGFSGAGIHTSKNTGEYVHGSPLNALRTNPPFHKYYFVDLDPRKTDQLKTLEEVNRNPNVHVINGDCNKVLPTTVFPEIQYGHYRRALCFLDPYGLHLNWEVVKRAADMRSIEIFLNFPIMDMHRNVFLRCFSSASSKNLKRMTNFWGDETWREVVGHRDQQNLLLNESDEKYSYIMIDRIYHKLADVFRQRLEGKANFKHVLKPILIRYSGRYLRRKLDPARGPPLYYLFFAGHNPTGAKIAESIFKKYRDKGM